MSDLASRLTGSTPTRELLMSTGEGDRSMELIAGSEDILLAAAFVIFGAAVLLLMPSVISSWLVRHLVQSDGAKLVGLVAGATGFIVLLFTAYQISVDLEDRIELRSELREDAIERYRSVLLRRAPGNTGKGEAITNIHDRGGSLEGWDASCKAVGLWDNDRQKCQQPATFTGLTIAGNRRLFSMLPALDDAILYDPQIVEADVKFVSLKRALATGAGIINSTMSGDFSDARFTGCVIMNSQIINSGEPPTLMFCEISGSLLPWFGGLHWSKRLGVFFRADNPPTQLLQLPDGEEVLAPLYEFDLQRLTICEPISTDESDADWVAKLYADFFSRIRFKLKDVLITDFPEFCTETTYESAKLRFPDVYQWPDDAVTITPKDGDFDGFGDD